MAHYRLGQYREVVAKFGFYGPEQPLAEYTMYPILAMARFRLGQTDQAMVSVKAATSFVFTINGPSNSDAIREFDLYRALVNEAAELMGLNVDWDALRK